MGSPVCCADTGLREGGRGGQDFISAGPTQCTLFPVPFYSGVLLVSCSNHA